MLRARVTRQQQGAFSRVPSLSPAWLARHPRPLLPDSPPGPPAAAKVLQGALSGCRGSAEPRSDWLEAAALAQSARPVR